MLILARDRGAGAQGASQDDRPGSGAVQRGAHAHSTCCQRVLSVWGATIACVCVFYLARCCQNLYWGWCNRQLGSGIDWSFIQILLSSYKPINGIYTKMICWKKIERGAMEGIRRSLYMFGSIFEFQTDTFDFVHVERQIKRKELTMLWNMQALTFLRRPASARIIWSIWHVHARYCTLCHVIPRALYSAACFAFVIPTAGRAMLRLEAPRRAQSCSGFSVF